MLVLGYPSLMGLLSGACMVVDFGDDVRVVILIGWCNSGLAGVTSGPALY